ncbi:MAG: hypothetical protein DCC68_04755 [Planctomycetota bacterium]|nr:MAG: hypothetical protein DCC68_04755 [Planctomycetota bacterium]
MTIHGIFPSPRNKKLKLAASGVSNDQPKISVGGRPTFAISSAMAASTCETDTALDTRMISRSPSRSTRTRGRW